MVIPCLWVVPICILYFFDPPFSERAAQLFQFPRASAKKRVIIDFGIYKLLDLALVPFCINEKSESDNVSREPWSWWYPIIETAQEDSHAGKSFLFTKCTSRKLSVFVYVQTPYRGFRRFVWDIEWYINTKNGLAQFYVLSHQINDWRKKMAQKPHNSHRSNWREDRER